MDYKYIYETLYKLGYHDKGKNHGSSYIRHFVNNYKFDTILEVGCANGSAVRDLHKNKKQAYGIDISSVAIRYCTEVTCVRNCIEASALDIPYKDKFFDAVFSCDVLEHLTPEDTRIAIKEIVRVAKHYLFLKISPELEFNRDWLNKAKAQKIRGFENIDNLHLTVMPHKEWIGMITEDRRVSFEKNISDLLIFRIR